MVKSSSSSSNTGTGSGADKVAKKARAAKKAAKAAAAAASDKQQKQQKQQKQNKDGGKKEKRAVASDGGGGEAEAAPPRRVTHGPNPRKLYKLTVATQKQRGLLLRCAPFGRLARSYVNGEQVRFKRQSLRLLQAAAEQRGVSMLRNASDLQAATKAGMRMNGPALDTYMGTTAVSTF